MQTIPSPNEPLILYLVGMDVAFAGLIPGGIGLYQIVLRVPKDIDTSGSVRCR